ncbi:PEP-CTERM sorting domain-containing protein [Aeoliella sp. ICT_H6.2]|uniref:PEP-CTERM sorting domain-containing protein n=1 Tax=Aeoliella straminimaris TaxID=2954799 RepID=A0A9X2JIG3_9BACT|nr:PEP-CTERM sorting domain-containing protein [Aeoliella straminimaris]MCO6046542.1 PEP-CTERM sorting domain-containing protein [Aeoliella straminimaris]
MCKLRLILGSWILLAGTAASSLGADITLTASDGFGTSSFNSAGAWSNASAPSTGNDYFTGDFRLRTPADGESYTFEGDSLTINNNVALTDGNLFGFSYKGTGDAGTITVDNLILNGGSVNHLNGSGDIFNLDGSISVVSDSVIYAKQGPINVLSDISGTGTITNPGSDGTGSVLSFLSADNTFTGSIVNNGRFTLADGAALNFVVGSSGVNNSVTGSGAATVFDGVFNFDLSGASTGASDSWQITDAATQTYGATFSVADFDKTGPFWTNGTYTFNTSTGVLSVGGVDFTQWAVDADGSFSVGTNWVGGEAPAPGDDILFGDVITQDRVVTLDASVTSNTIFFANDGDGDYFLTADSNQTITMTGAAEINTTGRHWLRAGVAGASGLNLSGSGELVLDAANTFTGGLSIDDTNTSVVDAGAIPTGSNITLQNAAALRFWGTDNGFFGDTHGTGYTSGSVSGNVSIDGTSVVEVNDGAEVAFTGVISGDGQLAVNSGSTVVVSGSNTYGGLTTVNGGTLTINNAAALGTGGTAASRTITSGNANTGTLALSGNITVASEVLEVSAREGAAFDAVSVTSAGNNTWNGNVLGTIGGTQYNFESTSGTLSLGGVISAPDTGVRNFVFSGDGNFNLTGRLTDGVADADGNPTGGAGGEANVHVFKRGSGTLTVGTNVDDDYWFGNTTVEEGTLVLTANAASDNELFSNVTTVQAGATLNVSSFADYDLGEGDELAGGGTVQVQRLDIYDDNTLSPNGTLTVTGNATLTGGFGGGALNVALGSTTAVGDRVQIDGNFTTTDAPAITVQVTPVGGTLQGSGANYTLINHGTGTAADVAAFNAEVVNNLGETLNPRQTLQVNSTSSQVRLQVNGTQSNLTWAGSTGNSTWDVATSTNWSSSNQFRDLDTVTFGSSGAKNVVVDSNVTPGSTTFSSASTYTFTGSGGITGYGPVNVNAGTVKFQNAGTNYVGTTTVASGAALEIDTASTGSIIVNGTLAVGSTPLSALPEFTYVDADHNSNTTLSGGGALVPAADIWEVRTGIGGNSDTIYEADAADPTTAPEIRTTISGLSANTTYTVYANFWDADGSSWRIQAGDTSGNLTLYGNPNDAVAGATDSVLTTSLPHTTELSTASGNRTLFSAPLGEFTTDASGNLVVYVDDAGTEDGDDRTFYDGLSYNSGQTNVFGGGETLTINGDLSLNSGSTLELDLGAAGSDSLDITGTALLDGTIDVSYFGDSPANGTQYTLLSAASGITTPLVSLDFGAGLPEGFTASYNEALTDLVLTFAAGLQGDFNGDGMVDLADYTVWRNNLGGDEAALASGTGNNSGIVDAGDYSLWKSNFGAMSGAVSGIASGNVPEPSSVVLLAGIVGCGALALRRRGQERFTTDR